MARNLFLVLIEDDRKLHPDRNYPNKYTIDQEESHNLLSVFVTKKEAEQFAEHMAQKRPGLDVTVFVQETSYFSTANPATKKKWNADKTLTPA